MLSDLMRKQNYYNSQFNPYNNKIYSEQDIRFVEFLEWLNLQEQKIQDVVTIALHLSTAYQTKFSPLEHPPTDDEILKDVEEVQRRLGVDFLYDFNTEEIKNGKL